MKIEKLISIHDFVEDVKEQEYKTGVNDCYMNALKVVDIVSGSSFHETLLNKYKTFKTGLKRASKLVGYSNIDELLKDYSVEMEKNYASTGDIVLIDIKQDYFACLIHMGNSLFQSGDKKQKASFISLDEIEGMTARYFRIKESK
ncbi:hypothetical protein C942_00508 [Photobacterium marinum]|uniref:DUF6950 domain-containing protein n=1 Tax=Photobacterium marinum TaxID=1056511 RepID=L8JB79_9GAMM|nr:hypothetical protein [Photobacterium marinum]ELR66066.1 hypothetical protein C942_00508 [Photobacterium marinum]